MRVTTLLLVVAAVAALAWSAEQGGRRAVVAAPPPIRAVDRPVPAELAPFLASELGLQTKRTGVTQYVCIVWSSKQRSCTAAEIARSQLEARRRQDALRPALAEAPRVVAELPLQERSAVLLAWWTAAGDLCLQAATLPVGASTDTIGPCAAAATRAVGERPAPSDACDAICLQSVGSGTTPGTMRYLLAGTVARGATALRITQAGGAVTTYPLRGPIVPHTRRRAFLLDLGGNDWRTLALLRGGAVLETRSLPKAQVALETCRRTYSAPQDVESCIRRSVP